MLCKRLYLVIIYTLHIRISIYFPIGIEVCSNGNYEPFGTFHPNVQRNLIETNRIIVIIISIIGKTMRLSTHLRIYEQNN